MAESDAFYLDLIPTIEQVFVDFGAPVQICTPEFYDRALMRKTGGSVLRTVLGVVNNKALASNTAVGNQILASLVMSQNSVELLLPPSAEPNAEEEVIVDDKRYSLGSVTTLKPGNIVLLYSLELVK